MNTMNVFFIAVWIIVAAEKDEARPNKKTGRAVHYNGSWSRWRTDRSTRGKGVVPWKYGFRDYIESYGSVEVWVQGLH